MATLVEYTPKLQRAVNMVIAPLGIKEVQSPHRFGRSTFTDRKGAYSEGGGYNGMFKCEMYQKDENTIVVRIYDGTEIWDARYDTDIDWFKSRSAGVALVNNQPYHVKNFYKEYAGPPAVSYPLKYFVVFDASEGYSPPSVTIQEFGAESQEWYPDYDPYKSFCLIAIWYGNDNRFVQVHNGGAPNLLWFSDCVTKESEVSNA